MVGSLVGGQSGWRSESLEVRVGRTPLVRSFGSAGAEVASAVGGGNDGSATSDIIVDLLCMFVGTWIIIGAGSAPSAFGAGVGKVCAARSTVLSPRHIDRWSSVACAALIFELRGAILIGVD